MNKPDIAYLLAWIGTACWGVCFLWMHRISQRQDSLMCELHEQGKRIEQLSKEENDLIKEVHPKIGQIQEQMGQVADEVHGSRHS